MSKIVKWEYFFVFDDGERESMWEINRHKGVNLHAHQIKMLNDHQFQKTDKNYKFVMVASFANGTTKEI